MTTALTLNKGSFRDPRGHVYEANSRIFRTIHAEAEDDYLFLRDNGIYDAFAEKGWLVGTVEQDPKAHGIADPRVRFLVEHPRLPFLSFPYEWPFHALRDAALLHLDLQLALLEKGATLSDASAYNIQFVGARPIFIDLLSIKRYQDGEFWLGHQQFCDQFLNPLLLRAYLGLPHNGLFRGNMDGIPTADLARLLPMRRKLLSWGTLNHVALPAWIQGRAVRGGRSQAAKTIERKRLPRTAFTHMLKQLRRWIATLTPADTGVTVWSDYTRQHSYSTEGNEFKKAFVEDFAGRVQPNMLWDLGCNTGDYAALALQSGARSVIGFDIDRMTVEIAYQRARQEDLNFLPLLMDWVNPSPGSGWLEQERPGLLQRRSADAILALAFIHHLAIGRNLPLEQVVDWLVSLAPAGVIEFVPKEDSMVQDMLSMREDIFPDYTDEAFSSHLSRRAEIHAKVKVPGGVRTLYRYEARAAGNTAA